MNRCQSALLIVMVYNSLVLIDTNNTHNTLFTTVNHKKFMFSLRSIDSWFFFPLPCLDHKRWLKKTTTCFLCIRRVSHIQDIGDAVYTKVLYEMWFSIYRIPYILGIWHCFCRSKIFLSWVYSILFYFNLKPFAIF